MAGGGFLTLLVSAGAGILGGIDLSVPAIVGGNVGLWSAFAAAMRNKRRRDLIGDAAHWLLKGPVGKLAFSLGSIGTRGKALSAGAHRPTEMAISIAADRLFEDLPKELRRELKGLPATIERLEADAKVMRVQVEELSAVLAEVGDDPERVGAAERAELRADLERTREEAKGRMTDAVSALEKIRLGLLRLHAGDGTVEGLTMQLGSANELSRAIDRLLEGQRDVARMLRPPRVQTDP